MRWLEVHIDTNHAGLDTVQAMLSGLDVDGVMIEDEEEFQDFLENNHDYWDYVDEDLERHMAGRSRITFYLEAREAGFAKLGEVRVALEGLKQERRDLGTLLMTLEDVEDADWENNWKQYYKPMEIGERLMVIPDWEEADPRGRAALRLNPGLAFGTGGHATTRLCLTALEKIVEPGMKVLDLGCGSGILSIAALLLGAERAFACDIDDKAVDVAYENAALNGVDRERYAVRAGDVLSDAGLRKEMGTGYDVVVANIVSDVIIALAPAVRGLMKEGGRFLASGIIDSREEEVRAALEAAGLTVEEARASEGWVSFLCN